MGIVRMGTLEQGPLSPAFSILLQLLLLLIGTSTISGYQTLLFSAGRSLICQCWGLYLDIRAPSSSPPKTPPQHERGLYTHYLAIFNYQCPAKADHYPSALFLVLFSLTLLSSLLYPMVPACNRAEKC